MTHHQQTPHRWKAVAYLHAAVNDHAELTVAESIAAQRAACLNYGKRVGLTVAREFVDAGNTNRRPMLDQLHSYLAEHPEIRHVIVESRSHLSPKPEGADHIAQRLERIGVRVLSSDTIYASPTLDPMARAIQEALTIVAKIRSEEHGRDVREGKRRARERREAAATMTCTADAVPAEGTRR